MNIGDPLDEKARKRLIVSRDLCSRLINSTEDIFFLTKHREWLDKISEYLNEQIGRHTHE